MKILALDEFDRLNCPIYKSICEIGDPWLMLIIRESFLGTKRFEDYKEILNISKSVLANKLKVLVDREILIKKEYKEPSQRKRYEYRLTQKGKDFFLIVLAMIEWGNKYLVDEKGDRAKLIKRGTNSEVVLKLVDRDGKELDLKELSVQFYRSS